MAPSTRAAVETRLAELFPNIDALMALAAEQGLVLKAPEGADAAEVADALVNLAERAGRTKGLLRSCLRRHPDDPTLREALRRDPRFAGEPSLGPTSSAVEVASSLRAGLAAWRPTHVWSLDASARQVAALLAGGLGEVQRIDPPEDPTEALDLLKTLGAAPDAPLRVVLMASTPSGMELGRALVERAQSLKLQLRLVEAEASAERPAPRPGDAPS